MRPWLAIALICMVGSAVAAPAGKTADSLVRLERGACERRCAVYHVTLHADGRVVYQGQHFVRQSGTRTARIKPAAVRELVAQFEALKFFELKDIYGEPGDCETRREDAPRAALGLNLGGRSKTVRWNAGCVGPVTSRLTELGDALDRLANVKRWIR